MTLSREVDRLLARVSATRARRRAMREELMAHLLGAFEQELAHHGDSNQAARAALARFGADDALSHALALTVPWLERTLCKILHPKEQPMSRIVLLTGAAVFFTGMGLMLPALAALRNNWSPAAAHGAMLMLGGLIALAGVASTVRGLVTARRGRRTT
jgi:hypothetical protein